MNASLDLSQDAVAVTAQLVDVYSVSGEEKVLADLVETALRALPHLTVERVGNNVMARTELGRAERIMLAGHLDTVPTADNVPHRVEGTRMYGCGTSDMKSGVAVQLRLAHELTAPSRDLTFVFYDNEEVESSKSGLLQIEQHHADWLRADFAVLLEPTGGVVEGGCQGTVRAKVKTTGVRAHAARSWLGENAIHKAGPILARLQEYQERDQRVVIDGLEYHEGLNAVGIEGGVAGNVIPDECTVEVNFRFAPNRSKEQAVEHVKSVFEGFDIKITDSAAGAMPGLSLPAAAAFIQAVGGAPRAKFGWTDVARFSALGVPAVNYSPGEPTMAHKRDEWVEMPLILEAEENLKRWLA